MSEQKTVIAEAATQKASTRTITIISTRGEKKKIAFEGSEWKQLKPLVEKAGFSLSNMKAVEGNTKLTLEHPDAVVPDGDFALFLMPYKSKSGGQSRAELYATIKELIEKDGDKAKDYFNMGNNYTRKSSSDLADMIEDYKPGTKKKKKKLQAEAIIDTANNASEAINNGSADDRAEVIGEVSKMSTEEKLNFAIALILSVKADVEAIKKSGLAGIVNGLQEAAAPVETEEQRVAREEAEAAEALRQKEEKEEEERQQAQREKEAEEERQRQQVDKEETEALQKQMRSLAGGFDDVRV